MRVKIINKRPIIFVCLCASWLAAPGYAQPTLVPMVELIAHPAESIENYPEGVSTLGYLRFDRGGGASLFLTRDHALAGDIGSALFLVDDTEDGQIYGMKCDNEYVRVIGMLVVDGGQLSLSKIESIERAEGVRSFCFRREDD